MSATLIQPLHGLINLPDNRGTLTLTGSQRADLTAGDAGRCVIYVAGLGGCYAWARPFWEECLQANLIDTIIGLDLRLFGVNKDVSAPNGVDDCISDLSYLSHPEHIKKALGIEQTKALYWAGISLGALLSIHSIHENQSHYNGLIMFVPAFQGNPKTYSLFYVMSAIIALATRDKVYMLDLPYGIDYVTQNKDVCAHHKQNHGDVPMQQQVGFMLSIMKWQSKRKKALKQITLPSFMATAGQDKICDTRSMHKGFKQLPMHDNHMLAHFPTLYHDILLEPRRHEVREALSLWLSNSKTSCPILGGV